MGQCSLGELTVDHTRSNLDGNFVFAVKGVKVGRGVVAVLHGDHDPEEATDLWHGAV